MADAGFFEIFQIDDPAAAAGKRCFGYFDVGILLIGKM